MKLQSREREILIVCHQQQFSSWDQIRQNFFQGNHQAAWNKLTQLVTDGYLKRLPARPGVSSALLRVTAKGKRQAEADSALVVPQLKRLVTSTLEHDLLVTDVRLRLSHFWDASWIPERCLKVAEYPQIPDGILKFRSGRKIAVELENTVKTKARYQLLWRKWAGTQTALVLYVATSAGIAACLKRLLPSDAPKEIVFGVVQWKELGSGRPLIWTTRGEFDFLAGREF